MRLITEVEAAKLRGGFYTPDSVVDFCLQRVASLTSRVALRVLEPAAGDGAFVRGIARRDDINCSEITCVEVVPGEASECRQHIASARIPGSVIADSYFNWVLDAGPQAFTAVVGNPPYVRYQFVPPEDRQAAEQGLSRYGMDLAGVSNLWIPFLLLSLSQLAPGGVFALVLPHELLATVSAAQVRQFLVRQFKGIRVDLFPRTTFPDILQDVLVVSGQRRSRAASSAQVRFAEHGPNGTETWRHRVPASGDSWTRYLLAHDQVQAFGAGQALAGFRRLGDIARLQVAVITGANSFFTVSSAVLGEYSLQDFARPLLARTEDSPGLVFTPADHAAAQAAGKRTWLLDFVENGIEPETHPGVARYLQQGMIDGLHTRYKCRIRKPWYAVPHIRSGSLMMSKRSHQHHRLLHNPSRVFTTDTIYRGEMLPDHRGRESDLVAGFHNSLTLLSAEVEGRTYGGGVLELVPSEVSRLAVPLLSTNGELSGLDRLSRSNGGQKDESDALVEATDRVLAARVPGLSEVLGDIVEARLRLRNRRFARA